MIAPQAEAGVCFRYAVCDEFLAPAELAEVADRAFADPSAYRASNVVGATNVRHVDTVHRRSLVRFDEAFIEALFRARLSAYAGTIFERLCVAPFRVQHLEIQLTRTGDGEFFRAHRDNHSNTVRDRYVTFVYYFHREPKGFRGGELRLFAARRDGEASPSTGEYVDVQPRQNRLLVFPSFLLHELRPVSVPSGRFDDGRFTVNGWFHV